MELADIRSKINEIYSLEQLSAGSTSIHRIHPLSKMGVTGIYLLCVISFDRYSAVRLAPYLFYPIMVMVLAEIPFGMVLKRAAVALPFCLFAGISNLIFDRDPAFVLGGVTVSLGALSLWTLLFRTLLCVSAVLILAAVTPFSRLMEQLRRLHMPEMLVTLLEMIYRYIGVLGEEAVSMVTAFRLRGNGAKWPTPGQFAPFVGQLLLRSADRAERVHQAMQCRGYALQDRKRKPVKWRGADWAFLLFWGGLSLSFRFWDVPLLLGGWLT
ncbi:MAG: cobalt ECF transporter T component CbiQ [Candidatus Gastranaerophilales bacterium]|nr:cobalt ECF transporter T component CbiQ [Candidatus Gastranaerophilales bacterium]